MNFPTPEERYYRYVAFCMLLGQEPLSKADWLWQTWRLVPNKEPIAWRESHA